MVSLVPPLIQPGSRDPVFLFMKTLRCLQEPTSEISPRLQRVEIICQVIAGFEKSKTTKFLETSKAWASY